MREKIRSILMPVLAIGALATLSWEDIRIAYYFTVHEPQATRALTYEEQEPRLYDPLAAESEKYRKATDMIDSELWIQHGETSYLPLGESYQKTRDFFDSRLANDLGRDRKETDLV